MRLFIKFILPQELPARVVYHEVVKTKRSYMREITTVDQTQPRHTGQTFINFCVHIVQCTSLDYVHCTGPTMHWSYQDKLVGTYIGYNVHRTYSTTKDQIHPQYSRLTQSVRALFIIRMYRPNVCTILLTSVFLKVLQYSDFLSDYILVIQYYNLDMILMLYVQIILPSNLFRYEY